MGINNELSPPKLCNYNRRIIMARPKSGGKNKKSTVPAKVIARKRAKRSVGFYIGDDSVPDLVNKVKAVTNARTIR